MKLKKSEWIVGILLTLSLLNFSAQAQNTQDCEKIVLQIYEGINQKKASHLTQYLASDFSMAGQKGEIAHIIFPEYITQLNEKVSDIKKLSESSSSQGLTLIYEARFAEMGIRKSTFVFNPQNKLIKMDLLPTKVQNKKG